MAIRKSAAGCVLAALLGLFVLVYAVGNGGAASVNTSVGIKMSPHYVPPGDTGVIVVSFTNKGPSAVNHVLATATVPIPRGSFATPPANCTVDPATPTSSTLTCDFGQVKTAVLRRVFSFTSPAAAIVSIVSFNAQVSATFDESKGSQNTD